MPTTVCPQCGRKIPFEMHEMHLLLECARCNSRFTPAGGLIAKQTPPVRKPLPAPSPSPSPAPQEPEAAVPEVEANETLRAPSPPIGSDLATWSLGLGVASLLSILMPSYWPLALPLGGLALVLGVTGLTDHALGRGKFLAGTIAAGIAVALAACMILASHVITQSTSGLEKALEAFK